MDDDMNSREKDHLRFLAWDKVASTLSDSFQNELRFDTLAVPGDLSRTESQTMVRIGTLTTEHSEYPYLLTIVAGDDTHEIGRIAFRIATEVSRQIVAERDVPDAAATVSQNFESRDPERIDIVLDELRKYWVKHPDHRLSQIIGNAARTAGYKNGGYGMEDDTLLNNLTPFRSTEFKFSGGRPRPLTD